MRQQRISCDSFCQCIVVISLFIDIFLDLIGRPYKQVVDEIKRTKILCKFHTYVQRGKNTNATSSSLIVSVVVCKWAYTCMNGDIRTKRQMDTTSCRSVYPQLKKLNMTENFVGKISEIGTHRPVIGDLDYFDVMR